MMDEAGLLPECSSPYQGREEKRKTETEPNPLGHGWSWEALLNFFSLEL